MMVMMARKREREDGTVKRSIHKNFLAERETYTKYSIGS
jgi:hypothetical protein